MANIRVNTGALSWTNFHIPGVTSGYADGRDAVTLEINPGIYKFQQPSGVGFSFTVTPGGTVDYSVECENFLEGRGTDTLVVKGSKISVDATRLSHDIVLALGGIKLSRDGVHELILLPSQGYSLFATAGVNADFRFGVTTDGALTVDPKYSGFAHAAGRVLTIDGYLVTLDTRKLSHAIVPAMMGADVRLKPDQPHDFTYLPAQGYSFYATSGVNADFRFGVTTDGALTVDPKYSGFAHAVGRVLTIDGYTVTVDTRKLSHALGTTMFGTTKLTPDQPHNFNYMPGSGYSFYTASGVNADFRFGVTPGGEVVVDPKYSGFAHAVGRVLTIDGYTVTIDTRKLSHALGPIILEANVELGPNQPNSLTYMPAAGYCFYSAPGVVADFRFAVTAGGRVAIDTRYGGFSRADGLVLTIDGYQVTVDGTALPTGVLPRLRGWSAGPLPNTSTHDLGLIPGKKYQFPPCLLSLDVDGTVTVEGEGLRAWTRTRPEAPTTMPQGTPTPVQVPAAVAEAVAASSLAFDPATGWPPRLPSTGVPVEAKPSLTPFGASDWKRYLQAALDDEGVKRLAGEGAEWLGCLTLEPRDSAGMDVLVSLRSPTTGRVVDVQMSDGIVTGAEEREPWEHPETPAEMNRAIELIKNHPEHSEAVAGLEAHAILRVPTDTRSPAYRHRCMHVVFTEPDDPHQERPVCCAALVDVQTDTIVAFGKNLCA
ncbi:hypothetical protein [Streptomyces sp. NPDC020951]|uniref:hypothetical protein n=1 Tax=Streptomyces sp. NPDC020951 TaxID=3365104 RepID=UPI0037920BEA